MLGVTPAKSAGVAECVRVVGHAEAGVVARVGERLRDDLGVQRTRPRVALTVVADHPDADAFDHRDRE